MVNPSDQTVRALLASLDIIGHADLPEILGISEQRIKALRAKRIKLIAAGKPDQAATDALPTPLPLPGDPLYLRSEIIEWGKRSGRLDRAGSPVRAMPPGRRRKEPLSVSAGRACLVRIAERALWREVGGGQRRPASHDDAVERFAELARQNPETAFIPDNQHFAVMMESARGDREKLRKMFLGWLPD